MEIIDNNATQKKNGLGPRLVDWGKSLFKGPPKLKSIEPNKTVEEKDRLKELLNRIDHLDKNNKLSSMPEEIRTDLHAQIRSMVITGFNNGTIATKSNLHATIASAKADEFYREFNSITDKQIKSLTDEISTKQDVVEDKKQQSKMHHSYQAYLTHHHKFNERNNTIGEFILYFIIFLIIFLADIPLSVEMIKRLFHTPMSNQPVSLSNISENWESVLTAIGISSSMIYIKVWYDEFVGRKFGHSVISRKKFIELFKKDEHVVIELTEKEKNSIVRHSWFTRIVKAIILLFTIGVIIILGWFRSFAWLKSQGLRSAIPPEVLTLTLTAITLLFCVISGICLSIALSAYSNYKRLKNCKNENLELEKAYVEESKKVSVLLGEKARAEANQKHWGDLNAWKYRMKELLSAYYNMGYNEGISEPGYFTKHLDFFAKLLDWREKVIAQKISNILVNKNEIV